MVDYDYICKRINNEISINLSMSNRKEFHYGVVRGLQLALICVEVAKVEENNLNKINKKVV
jgi:hypothetical protein